MKINPRRFNKRIYFLSNKTLTDIEQAEWEEAFYSWGEILPIFDNKLENISLDSLQAISQPYFMFIMRYDKNINNKLRIKYKERIFTIKRVVNIDEASKFLKILAIENIAS